MGILTFKYTNSEKASLATFHVPTSKKALIIFARHPELGTCKTRLAKTIGDENALNIYNILLQHTAKVSARVTANRYVFYADQIKSNDIWDDTCFRKKKQQGIDLGARMHNAFSELFQNNYKKVVIIGSDLLDLSQEHINDAFEKLNAHDVVIGPAQDGGYYLLGMNNLQSSIFENKAWSTNTVLEETLKNLKNKSVYLLEELNDIDTFEDIKHYPQFNTISKTS